MTATTAAAQIYIFTLYPGPKFTQPTFTQKPNLHNTKFTRDPYLHEPTFTLPQIYITQFYTNPIYTATKLHQTQIFTVPNLHRSQFYITKGHTLSPGPNCLVFCSLFERPPRFEQSCWYFSKGLLKKCVNVCQDMSLLFDSCHLKFAI